jgi:succinyl-CoA synthetase beta subunit
VEGGLVKTPEEAVALFEALGAPVVVKVSSPDVLHKAKVGGLRLDVTTTDAVRGAFMDIQAATLDAQPQATVDGVRIERQVTGLQEVLVSGFVDPIFGPMVAVGRGGSQVEAMDDVVMAMAPVSMPFAERMVENLTSGPNNDGGAARTESLVDVVIKVSELAATSVEAEINPLTWTGTEWLAVDAVVRR